LSSPAYQSLTTIAECYREALSLLAIFYWLGYKTEDTRISIENDRMMGVDLVPAKLCFLTGKVPDADWDPDDGKVLEKITSRWEPYVTAFNALIPAEQKKFVEASRTYALRDELRDCLLRNNVMAPAWADA